jgi:hypothetical protein
MMFAGARTPTKEKIKMAKLKITKGLKATATAFYTDGNLTITNANYIPIVGQTIAASSNIGANGIVGNTVYYVNTVATLTPTSANITVVPKTADTVGQTTVNPTANVASLTVPLTIQQVSRGFSKLLTLKDANGNVLPGQFANLGVVGGDTNLAGNQVVANVAIIKAGPVGAGATANNVSITVTSGSNAVTGLNTNFVGLTAGTVLSVNGVPTNDPVGGGLIIKDNVAIGTVSGTPTATSVTLAANANISGTFSSYNYAVPVAGSIIRQKGKTKYLVSEASSGLQGVCYLTPVANTALTPGQFSIMDANGPSGQGLNPKYLTNARVVDADGDVAYASFDVATANSIIPSPGSDVAQLPAG